MNREKIIDSTVKECHNLLDKFADPSKYNAQEVLHRFLILQSESVRHLLIIFLALKEKKYPSDIDFENEFDFWKGIQLQVFKHFEAITLPEPTENSETSPHP